MKKLNKELIASRDRIAGSLRDALEPVTKAVEDYNTKRQEAWAVLEAAIIKYNEDMSEAWGTVSEAQDAFNEVVTEANEWMGQVASEIDDYTSERSEKWQEGDAAQAYAEWKESFEETIPTSDIEEPEQIEVDEPDDLAIDSDSEDPADKLEQLPEELGS